MLIHRAEKLTAKSRENLRQIKEENLRPLIASRHFR